MEDFEIARIYRSIRPRIIGREREVKSVLAALKSGRNIVLEGPPGTSKSTILREITQEIHVPISIVEGSAELTPAKLVGTHNPAKVLAGGYTQEAFDHGPLTDAMLGGGFLYLEEFNRMPEDVMNVLLRAMDERRIAIPRVGEIQAKPSFRMVGAMNPFDDVGTERLSRAISDRLCRIELDYQSEAEEIEIVERVTGVHAPALCGLAVRLVRRTREHPDLNMGASVRGAIDFVLIANERLAVEGIDPSADLSLGDPSVREVLLDCAIVALSGRVWVSETADRKAKDIVREIWEDLQRMAVPGLPEGKMKPGVGDPGDESPSLPTSHSPPGAEPVKKKTEADDGKGARGEPDSKTMMLGITAAQKQSLGESVEIDVPLNARSLPQILRGRRLPVEGSAEREEAKRIAEKMVLRFRRPRRGPERRRGKFSSLPYSHASAEIDIDRTIEKIVGNDSLRYSDFIVRDRSREKRSYVLILDVSGSMRGDAILRAMIAVVAFVKSLREDSYSIVTFSDRASILKRMRQGRSFARLLHEIFAVPADGMTDIASGLRAGLLELRKCSSKRRVAILVTDGAHNKSSDPFSLARQFSELHVIGVDCPWPAAQSTCKALARLGKGTSRSLEGVRGIPEAIRSVLER